VSGERTHKALSNSQIETSKGGPLGLNASHDDAFNQALIAFLKS
jgi:pimeloyl-ACP methyl ester carboxylesterase